MEFIIVLIFEVMYLTVKTALYHCMKTLKNTSNKNNEYENENLYDSDKNGKMNKQKNSKTSILILFIF
jgi:hypothetical protein